MPSVAQRLLVRLAASAVPVRTTVLVAATGAPRRQVWAALMRLELAGLVVCETKKSDPPDRAPCPCCGHVPRKRSGRRESYWTKSQKKGGYQVTLEEAKRRISAGAAFDSVYERLVEADRIALKEWYVAEPGVPNVAARDAARIKKVARTGTLIPAATASGFTGDMCVKCGGGRMLRVGSCLTCNDCGETTGCG